jgi:hypothetical protein
LLLNGRSADSCLNHSSTLDRLENQIFLLASARSAGNRIALGSTSFRPLILAGVTTSCIHVNLDQQWTKCSHFVAAASFLLHLGLSAIGLDRLIQPWDFFWNVLDQ